MKDIIIIGAGPAGMTAALYALRADKSVLLLEKENFGGQITYSPKLENYPSVMEISGSAFAEKMLEQVMAHGAEIELAEVCVLHAGLHDDDAVLDDRFFEVCMRVASDNDVYSQIIRK